MNKGINSCNICNGDDALVHIGMVAAGLENNQHIYIEGKDLQIVFDDPRIPSLYIPINYCPRCGHRLKEKIHSITA